jgi:hypothetical protein
VLCPAFSVLSFPADPDVAFTHGPDGSARIRDSIRTEATSGTFTTLARAALPPAETARLISHLSENTALA